METEMSPREFLTRSSDDARRGGMVPAAAVLIVLGALSVCAGSLYISRPQPETFTAEQRDLVDRVTRLARSVERRVSHEKATLAAAADIGSVLPETLIQPAEPVAVEVLETPRESPAVLKLEGIAWNPKRPFAFINGSVVGVGDGLKGFTVTEIGKEKVVLEDAHDRRRELQLYD
jgi:hypothetical protein